MSGIRSGSEYLAAIAGDGRTVILDGEPIDDVTCHPGFRGPVHVIASLYDGAATAGLTAPDEEGTPRNAMWLVPASPADLAVRRRVHRHWAEGSFGLMGRTPDHVASLITGFAGRREVFDRGGSRYGDNVVAFHRAAREHDWYIAYAVTPPQVDRSKPAHLQPEPFLYPGIVEERADGIVLRGAQMIATSAAIADYLFVSSILPLQPGDEDYAVSAVMPLAAAGLRIHPRRPYAGATTDPFDAPLAVRFDESDSLVVLDDVFVPWEHVFVHRDPQLVGAQFHETGAHVLANFQALIRLQVKLEFVAGLAIEVADAHGLSAIPPVQAQLGGEIAALCAAIDALVVAAEARPERRGDQLIPAPRSVQAGLSLQRHWIVDLMRSLRELVGGGFIALPSGAALAAPDSADEFRRYYRSVALSADDRVALLRLVWDLVGTEFGGRQLQYEMFASSAQHIADLRMFRSFDWSAGRAHVRRALDGTVGDE